MVALPAMSFAHRPSNKAAAGKAKLVELASGAQESNKVRMGLHVPEMFRHSLAQGLEHVFVTNDSKKSSSWLRDTLAPLTLFVILWWAA